MDTGLYTASEARQKLSDMASSTFHRLVTSGKIQKIVPPNKKQGMYAKAEIDALAGEMFGGNSNISNGIYNHEGAKIVVDWRRANDLPAILALDMEVYKDEVIGNYPTYHGWWKSNPYITLIAFEEGKRDRILANVTLLPLPESTILSVLKGDLLDKDIQPEAVQNFDKDGEFTLLAENVISRPESRQFLGPILNGFLEYFCEQWPKVKIRKIYAQATSPDGRYLVQKLYFGPLYDISDDAFVLDLRYENASRFIRNFQECIRAKERASNPENPELLTTNIARFFKQR